jgi:hypothetical protein
MTIRDYIKGRGRLLRVLTFGWFVLPVALIFIFPERAKTSGIMWLAVGYVVMAAIRYAIAWQTRCPRCGKSLWSVTDEGDFAAEQNHHLFVPKVWCES